MRKALEDSMRECEGRVVEGRNGRGEEGGAAVFRCESDRGEEGGAAVFMDLWKVYRISIFDTRVGVVGY